MNNCVVIGRLSRDPEQRATNGGKTMVSFTICDDAGKEKEPNWVRVTLSEKLGTAIYRYLHKGTMVAVTGRIEMRKFTGKDGAEKATLEMAFPNDVRLLGGKDEPSAPAEKPAANGWKDLESADIPF